MPHPEAPIIKNPKPIKSNSIAKALKRFVLAQHVENDHHQTITQNSKNSRWLTYKYPDPPLSLARPRWDEFIFRKHESRCPFGQHDGEAVGALLSDFLSQSMDGQVWSVVQTEWRPNDRLQN